MKRFSEQLHKKASTVSLRAAERRALRERVVSYMEYHPLPETLKKKRVFADVAALTEDYRVIHIPFTWVARFAASVAVLVFVVVPVLAEQSVPGDGLYAVKVRFNEEVRSTLSFSTSEKVAWETERLNRRISEARLLASEGKLTSEVEASVAEAVRSHADEAQRNIEILRDVDADEAALASIAFETTLEVQSASLRKQPAADEGVLMMAVAMDTSMAKSEEPVDLLSSVLQDSIAKNTASSEAHSLPAFDKTMAKVEQNTTRIYELLDSIDEVTTEAQRAEVTRRATDIERSIETIVATRSVDEVAAQTALIEVLQRTQRLIVYLNDLAISSTVDIEELVPVMLTEAEKQLEMNQFKADIDAYIEQIENALISAPDAAITEKATVALEQLRFQRAIIASSTEYEISKAEASAAQAVAIDTLNLFSLELVPMVEVPISEVATSSTPTTTEAVGSTTESVVEQSTEQVDPA